MKRMLIALTLIVATVVPVRAADATPFDAAAAVKLLAPFLDEQTIAVGRVDVAAIDLDAAMDKIVKYTGQQPGELAPARQAVRDFQARFTRAGGRDAYVIVSVADLAQRAPVVIVPVSAGADQAALREVLKVLTLEVTELHGALVVSGRGQIERLKTNRPAARPALGAALAAAGTAQVRVALVPGDDQRRTAVELFPKLPKELGGGLTEPLVNGLQWLAVGADVTPHVAVRLWVQTKDPASAQALEALAETALRLARTQAGQEIPLIDQITGVLQPKVEGDQLRVVFDENAAGVVQMSATLVQKAQESARRQQAMNNLKQLALAMHNYNDAYRGKLPSHAIYSKDGQTPLLSWRVAILPFIEQDNLYKQFKLDEPWDSEHNKKLIPLMPMVYQSPGLQAKEPGQTHCQVFVGGGAPWERGPKNPSIPRTFQDGTSNTILIAEAAEAVTWTKPDDLPYDPAKPLPKLGMGPMRGVMVALADGSVRVLNPKISEKTLRAAITAAGNETLGPDW